MKLRSKAPLLRDWTGQGHLTTDPARSPDGSPVLVVEGKGVVGPVEAYGLGYEILEADVDELEALRRAGYAIPYMGR